MKNSKSKKYLYLHNIVLVVLLIACGFKKYLPMSLAEIPVDLAIGFAVTASAAMVSYVVGPSLRKRLIVVRLLSEAQINTVLCLMLIATHALFMMTLGIIDVGQHASTTDSSIFTTVQIRILVGSAISIALTSTYLMGISREITK